MAVDLHDSAFALRRCVRFKPQPPAAWHLPIPSPSAELQEIVAATPKSRGLGDNAFGVSERRRGSSQVGDARPVAACDNVGRRYPGASDASRSPRASEAAIERLADAPTDEDLVLRDIWLLRLRALLARAQGDEAAYRDYRDRYRAMATSLSYEGHMNWAEAMP